MLMADEVGIKYTSGLEQPKKLRSSAIDLAVSKFDEVEMNLKEDVKEEPEEKESKGLWQREVSNVIFYRVC